MLISNGQGKENSPESNRQGGPFIGDTRVASLDLSRISKAKNCNNDYIDANVLNYHETWFQW